MSRYDVVTGSGENENTVDFSLSSDEVYTQGTGNSLDLTVLDVLEEALSETVSVNDARASSVFKAYDEQLALNDSDIRRLQKSLNEAVSLNDVDSKIVGKSQTEALSLNDFVEQQASFERNIPETLGVNTFTEISAVVNLFESLTLNDSDIRQVEKLLSEQVSSSDAATRESDFFRDYSENLTINEAFDSAKIQFADLSEQLGVATFADLKLDLRVFEQVGVSEDYSRVGDFSRSIDETAAVNDDERFRTQKTFSETVATATFAELDLAVKVVEQLGLNDVSTASILKSASEDLGVDDSVRERNVFKANFEKLGISDSDVRELSRSLREAFVVNDTFSRDAEYLRTADEDVSVDDADTRLFMKLLETETLAAADFEKFSVSKVLNDATGVDDLASTSADLFREYAEAVDIAEIRVIQQFLTRDFQESLGVDEEFNSFKTIIRTFEEVLGVAEEFDFFFSEGPGTPPYYVRNKFVQKNKLNNQFVTKTLQNVFESFNVSNNFGDQEQT